MCVLKALSLSNRIKPKWGEEEIKGGSPQKVERETEFLILFFGNSAPVIQNKEKRCWRSMWNCYSFVNWSRTWESIPYKAAECLVWYVDRCAHNVRDGHINLWHFHLLLWQQHTSTGHDIHY